MAVEVESGLEVTLPDGKSFRFSRSVTYQSLKGRALKEMDFGYKDDTADRLVLVELTSYTRETDIVPTSSLILLEMITKARDSLLMLQAAWRGHGSGKALRDELPEACRKESRIRICFVINVSPEHRKSLTPFVMSNLGGQVKSCVVASAALLDLNVHVELFDQRSVLGKLPIKDPHFGG